MKTRTQTQANEAARNMAREWAGDKFTAADVEAAFVPANRGYIITPARRAFGKKA